MAGAQAIRFARGTLIAIISRFLRASIANRPSSAIDGERCCVTRTPNLPSHVRLMHMLERAPSASLPVTTYRNPPQDSSTTVSAPSPHHAHQCTSPGAVCNCGLPHLTQARARSTCPPRRNLDLNLPNLLLNRVRHKRRENIHRRASWNTVLLDSGRGSTSSDVGG